MQFELNDERLKKALAIYCDGLLREIPEEESLRQVQTFSPRFEARMQRLIERAGMSQQQLKHQLVRRVASIVLIVTLGTTALMSVEAIRIPVLRFLAEVHETFTRIVFGGEEGAFPQEIEQIYVPGFVPEGFEVDFEMIDTSMVIISYTNGEDVFKWNQFCLNTPLYVNTEGVTLEEFTLNGRNYLYYSNLGMQNLIWEENGYCFICTGTLSKDALIDISESIKIKN